MQLNVRWPQCTELRAQQAVQPCLARSSYTNTVSCVCCVRMQGGALSFAAAQHVQGLSVAVPLYGTPAREMPWIEVSVPRRLHCVPRRLHIASQPVSERITVCDGTDARAPVTHSTKRTNLSAVWALSAMWAQVRVHPSAASACTSTPLSVPTKDLNATSVRTGELRLACAVLKLHLS